MENRVKCQIEPFLSQLTIILISFNIYVENIQNKLDEKMFKRKEENKDENDII